MHRQDSWSMADPLNLTLSLLWALVNLYGVVHAFTHCVLGIYWLRSLFVTFTVYVRPLHPDRAGGLSPIGKFSLALSYAVTLVGLLVVTTPITRNYLAYGRFRFRWTNDTLVALGAYVIAAPIVFFAPLSATHRAMKNAKRQLLLQIAQRFETEYINIQNALDDDISGLESSLKALRELHLLHEMTSEFPVWPANLDSIARFAASLVSPIALAVAADLLSRFITR